MKTSLTIATAGMLLAFTLPLRAQEPVDLSRAREFRTVWKMPLGGTAAPPTCFPDFCSIPGNDMILVASAQRHGFWRTRPRLDTAHSMELWSGVNAKLIDYDGIPPLEYVSNNGITFRCGGGDTVPAMVAIDTINTDCWGGRYTILNSTRSLDVDGDGHLDVLCDIGGGGFTARVIMGGPQWGKGCKRVVAIPRVPRIQTRANTLVRAFFKSATGRWRLIQKERHPSDLSPWMLLYDVDIVREGDTLKTTFTKLDSLLGGSSDVEAEPFGNVEVLVDTVSGRDYLLLQRVVDFDPVIVAVERFDVTAGRFTSTGEKITGLLFVMNWNLGYQLGTDKPVIGISSSSGLLFCYADNIRQPFARWIPAGTGIQPAAGHAVINDQTGDGKPDIVISGGPPETSSMILISLDPAVSVGSESRPAEAVPSATLTGDVLEVQLPAPVMVSADLVTTDGRMSGALLPAQGQAGQNRYDLAAVLRSVPRGAYYLRVRMGDVSHTISVIR